MSSDTREIAEHPSDMPVGRNHRKRKPVGRTLLILTLAAALFCVIVVADRDRQIKNAQINAMEPLRSWLKNYYEEWGFLPTALTDEAKAPKQQKVPYPTTAQLKELQKQPGPHLLVTGPYRGLIQPKADGAAGIVLENGEFHIKWITKPEIQRALEAREKTATGNKSGNDAAQNSAP